MNREDEREALRAMVEALRNERERERRRCIDRYDTTTIQEILSDERERLRAKADALQVFNVDSGVDPYRVVVEPLVRRADVLALFDGEQR